MEYYSNFVLLAYYVIPDEENWRNKNPKKKSFVKSRRAIHSILDPMIEPCKRLVLLKNEFTSTGRSPLHVENTCPFNALYMIIAALYADNQDVKSEVVRLINESKFCDMVVSMFGNEKSELKKQNKMHLKRNQILMPIFEELGRVIPVGKGHSINCASSVNYIIQKVLPTTMKSYTQKLECEKCMYVSTSQKCFIDINFARMEELGIVNLGECLHNMLMNASEIPVCRCGGQKKMSLQFSPFVMIDLHLPDRIESIRLSEIPEELHICSTRFRLYACIEYIGDDNIDSLGHYVAHMRRANRWEKFDDKKNKVDRSDLYSDLKAEILFYIRE